MKLTRSAGYTNRHLSRVIEDVNLFSLSLSLSIYLSIYLSLSLSLYLYFRLVNDPTMPALMSSGGATPLHVAAAKDYLKVVK